MTIAHVAKNFGIHPGTLEKWMRQEPVEPGEQSGTTTAEALELRELRKRNRLLDQEVQVLRRATAYRSQARLAGKRCSRSFVSSPLTGSPWQCRARH